MKLCFPCGEVISGCPVVFVGREHGELVAQASAHLLAHHEVPMAATDLAQAVHSAASPVPDLVAHALAPAPAAFQPPSGGDSRAAGPDSPAGRHEPGTTSLEDAEVGAQRGGAADDLPEGNGLPSQRVGGATTSTVGGTRDLVTASRALTARAPVTPVPGQDGALMRSVFDDAPVAVAVTTIDGVFVEGNQALCDLLGFSREQLTGMSVDDVVAPSDLRVLQDGRRQMVEERILRHRLELQLAVGDRVVPVEFNCALAMDADGHPEHIVCHLQDITDRRAAHSRLLRAAQCDPLTGLPNRAYFFEHLEQALRRRPESARHTVVLFCDLDRFKAINDTWGHHAGDQILIEFAGRLRRMIRAGDVCARLSGDEFVVLYPCDTPVDPKGLVRRIHRGMAAPFKVAEGVTTIRVSIGAATADLPDISATELVRRADQAMYDAKEGSRRRT